MKLIMLISTLLLAGCAHDGNITMRARSPDSITVAYRGFESEDELNAALDKILKENCSKYEWVKTDTGSGLLNGSTTTWWENTYKCPSRDPASK